MKSNNKPDSLVAACFGMAASFVIIAALSGCGGGAGSGGIDPNSNAPDIANGTLSADGNTYTISSFKNEFSLFSLIEKNDGAPQPASSANGTAIVGSDSTHTRPTEGTEYVDLNYISAPTTATNSVALSAEGNMGLNDWTPFRYLKFDVNTDASAFEGSVAVLSGASWLWCDASGSVPAGTKGTLTLDLNTCDAAKLDPVYVRRVMLLVKSTTAAGHFYIDNVRLEKGAPTPPSATDIADGTDSGNIYTITSFKTGLGSFAAEDNLGGSAGSNGTAVLDIASNGSDGSNSAYLNVTSIPAAANSWIGLASATSGGGHADLSAYRYLKFDLKAGASGYSGEAAILTGSYVWCGGSRTAIAAFGSGTVTLDMSTCSGMTDVRKLLIDSYATGSFYIDNVRLEKGAPAPVANDTADGTTSADGKTFTISSFKTGLSGFIAADNAGQPAGSNGSVVLDTASHGSEGNNSAYLNVTSIPAAAGSWIGLAYTDSGAGNANGGADWSAYRYLALDIKAVTAYSGELAILTPGWAWCATPQVDMTAGESRTVTLDLNTCADKAHVWKYLIDSKTAGSFYIDNVRLVKDDIADGTSSVSATEGNVYTITSFKTGLGGFRALNDNDTIAAGGTAVLDTVATHATEATNSAAVTVSNIPAGATSVGLALDSNGGLADWTPYRYLKVDIITGAADFNGAVSILSGNTWTYCDDKTWPWISAGAVPTTLVMDLTACAGANLADVRRIQVQNKLLGTFNIDNFRLTTQ